MDENYVREASVTNSIRKVIGKRDSSMVHQFLVQGVSLQQDVQLARFVGEGQGFGVESIWF